MRKFDQFFTQRIKLYEATTATADPFKKKEQGQVVQQAQAATAATNPATAPNPASKPSPAATSLVTPGAPATVQAAPQGGNQGQPVAQPVAGATTTPQAAGAPAPQPVATPVTSNNLAQQMDNIFKLTTTDPNALAVFNKKIAELTGRQQAPQTATTKG